MKHYMHEVPETRESLLIQVRDPQNREAWEQFAQIYRPVIVRTAVARGFQAADAQDLAQKVLVSVASAIGRWEKSSEDVRFRHWLARVTKNAILNVLTRGPRDLTIGDSIVKSMLEKQVARDKATESLVDLEVRRELFLRAAEIVRRDVQPETWDTFVLTVIEDNCISDVATQLNRSKGSIYTARSRVMCRLKEVVQDLSGEKT